MKKNNDIILNYETLLSYFLILLPIFLISGPFLSDLSVSILAISSLFFLKKKKYFNNYFFLFFSIFWILLIISSIFSENKFLSFKASSVYFRFCFFSLFVWWILERDKKILKKIYLVLIFCFLILIFDSAFQYFNGSNIFNMKIIEEGRISSFFGDELKMGGFLMRFFPLLFALSIYFYEEKKHKILISPMIIFIIFIQITIFLSGERTSFFLFNFSILLFLIFLNGFFKARFFLFIIYVIVLSLFFIIDSPFKKRIVNLTIEESQIYQSAKPKFIISQQYHEHFLSAWKMFEDNKLIGIGPNNFREKCKDKKYNFSKLTCSTHPHNTLLQLLSETGIFGFVIFLILNIVIWYNLIKNLYSKIFLNNHYLNNFQISLLINIAILTWPLSTNGNLFNNWLSIVLYYPVGFLLWELRNSKKMFLNITKKKGFFSKFNFTN